MFGLKKIKRNSMKKYNIEISLWSTLKISLGVFLALLATRMTEKKQVTNKIIVDKVALDSVKLELNKLHRLTDSLMRVKQNVIVVESKKKTKRRKQKIEPIDTLSL